MYYYKKKDMYIFTAEEKEQAHNISTLDFLSRRYGYTFKPSGNGYRCKEHDSLVVSNDCKGWFWNSRSIGGGDAIDFLKKIENKTYEQALIEILNPSSSEIKCEYTEAAKFSEASEERVLLLPPKAEGTFKRLFAYLNKTRCIDSTIIQTLVRKNYLYEDSRHNCVFVGYNQKGLPAYATLRTTLTEKKFRKDVIGSDKSNGFYLKGYNKNTVYVFEAPIDLLSHATIKNIAAGNNREWLNDTRISLGGVVDNALENFCRNNKDIESIVFCLDNDNAGIGATDKLMEKYAAMGYSVSSEPPKAKDYNEDLVNLIQSKSNKMTV